MEKKIEITDINIKIGRKEFSLSVKEAKELKGVLEELFKTEIIREHHHHHDRWYYEPQRLKPWETYWSITCGNDPVNTGISFGSVNTGTPLKNTIRTGLLQIENTGKDLDL